MKKSVVIFLLSVALPVHTSTFFSKLSREKREISKKKRVALKEKKAKLVLDRIIKNGRVILGARGPGFFSEFLGALNWLNWVENKPIALKILWGKQFLYSDDNDNHWGDFFEPFWDEMDFSEPSIKIVRSYFAEVDSLLFLIKANLFRRTTGCNLLTKYIKVRSEIVNEVEVFCNEHFLNKHVVAIHLRSGEKDREGKQVSPEMLVEFANSLKRENTVFFVLTDVEDYFEYAVKHLGGPVIATSCLRVDDWTEGVHEKYPGNLNIAHEALIDALIAAHSDLFLFTTSNLAFAVLLFNQDLHGISLRYDTQGEIKRYDYAISTDQEIVPEVFGSVK